MKKLVAILSILIISCGSNDLQKQETVDKNVEYFKDSRTNLCFGVIKSFNWDGSIWSFTCVPCDSVNHLLR